MEMYRSAFLKQAYARGFIHQCTDGEALDRQLCQGQVTAYTGFDASAPSLHVGSLIQMMLMRLFEQTGHRVIILLGGGTTQIGDPSGKDEARPLLSGAQIQSNLNNLSQIFQNFFEKPIILNNQTWLSSLNYLDVLNTLGRHFSMHRLLALESMRLRLDREQPLSFLEFNYPLLQAYDFLHIFKQTGCLLQFGGADQWGNIVSGVHLIRRIKGVQTFGLTTPLLTTAGGKKMGKTARGAVWLDPAQNSPYDYWQFWRNTHDEDVARFLRLFTDLPLEEIAQLDTYVGQERNKAKIALADAATTLLHGEQVLPTIHATNQVTFHGQKEAAQTLAQESFTRQDIEKGLALISCLENIGLAPSKSAARRLIRAGAISLNDQPIMQENYLLSVNDFRKNLLKISCGRKRHKLIALTRGNTFD